MLHNVNQIMVSMYSKGYTAEQIAEIFETNIETVATYLGQTINNRKKSDIIAPAVCSMYKEGKSIGSIASKLNTSRTTVRFILRQNKLQTHIPDACELQVLKLHKDKLSHKEIGLRLNIKPNRVSQILRLNGVQTEIKTRVFHQRKYHFNENFFDVINTEQKAYWLGFLYADGYVADRGVITVALAEKDKTHLEKFITAIELDKELNYCKRTKSYRIDICSRHMVKMLSLQGCVNRKSLILNFPNENQVPEQLVHHFMRGYFDGDGYVNVTEPKGNSRFQLLGTPQFLDVYEHILINHCTNTNKTKRIVHKQWNENTQAILYCGHRLNDIFNYLYKNATVFLDRKYKMFNRILTCPEPKSVEDSGV